MADIRLSQVAAEILRQGPADVKLSQVSVEVLRSFEAVRVRLSQISVEVLVAAEIPTSGSGAAGGASGGLSLSLGLSLALLFLISSRQADYWTIQMFLWMIEQGK